jgi:hypothetical protein
VLVDELGLEPGPQLQALQRAVLADDPELAGLGEVRHLLGRLDEALDSLTRALALLREPGR